MATKKIKLAKRTEYICTSISVSPEDIREITPLRIPENNKLLLMMADKLKQGDLKKSPLKKQNLGVKFSLEHMGVYKFIKKKLKVLNISLSTFYKECYFEFQKN